MDRASLVMLVRFKTALPIEQAKQITKERMPQFRALEGLTQKFYLIDESAGEVAGLYFWRSEDDLAEFKESELRASIPGAYQIVGEPRVEVYKVFDELRE